MRHRHLKNIALVAGGIALSILITALIYGRTEIGTPGAYLVRYLFPTGAVAGHYDLGTVLSVYLGTDFLVCFAALSGLYLVLSKLCHWGQNDPN